MIPLKTSCTRFSILLTILTALWLSLLSGNLLGFLNPIKLVTYFCQPGLVVCKSLIDEVLGYMEAYRCELDKETEADYRKIDADAQAR